MTNKMPNQTTNAYSDLIAQREFEVGLLKGAKYTLIMLVLLIVTFAVMRVWGWV